ncbi:hypothetical protein GCM10023211_09320 [Orbus sasakiae]|uniref:Uncharacterized protein n=1 Tax=Orbus sasakiae TaxID=1078475 RepID=A0ABP9N4W6_9GAMM
MMTLRALLKEKNIEYKKQNMSYLDEWFDEIIDIPLSELLVGDISRLIRQQIFICEMLPYALNLLSLDPLAGDSYDGQLISSLATLTTNDIEKCSFSFDEIKKIINQIDKSLLDNNLLTDIQKINTF